MAFGWTALAQYDRIDFGLDSAPDEQLKEVRNNVDWLDDNAADYCDVGTNQGSANTYTRVGHNNTVSDKRLKNSIVYL